MKDALTQYLSADQGTRIETIELDHVWRQCLVHHDYPESVRRLLGELCAAACLLAATLKFQGTLSLQMQGDGPITLLVVECRDDLSLRATVKVRDNAELPSEAGLQALLNQYGRGRFSVILDPRASGMQPYQGVVPLDGDSVADVLEHYMASSEQLDTRLTLAADDQHACGLLLQRMPGHGGHGAQDESTLDWDTACHLADTVKREELLATDMPTLMHRLFWQAPPQAFTPREVRWHCPCSREKVADMLRMLGQEEVEDILTEQEQVDVTCEFCGKPYRFDAVDCAALFTPPTNDQDPSSTLH